MTRYFLFDSALLSTGLISPACIGIDEEGIIQSVSSFQPDQKGEVENVKGIAFPGFQNCHSHAFQYAMAGLAERHAPGTNDDFWSWREAMYSCALSMDPDQIQTVATALYIEMLQQGYTHVAEFHYLHHDKNGKPYNNPAETGISLIAAAAIAGIKITIIPVFYRKGGFGKPARHNQRRFIFSSRDEYLRLLEQTAKVASRITTARLGYGVHSLRAADPADVKEIFRDGPTHLPFHLHASEQKKEVDDSMAYLKMRPVEWLLENLPVNEQFNIVHCTHLSDTEVEKLALSKAQVVLCPGTEGNLGDGIFRLTDFIRYNGNWCIGTDSHISLNPLEDLRWLDYGQRLITNRRNTFNDGGLTMIRQSYLCGSKAMGIETSQFFEAGKPFDAVVYESDGSVISDPSSDSAIARILYTADSRSILGTIVNGRWMVKNGFHDQSDQIRTLFKGLVKDLTEQKG